MAAGGGETGGSTELAVAWMRRRGPESSLHAATLSVHPPLSPAGFTLFVAVGLSGWYAL